MTNIIAILQWAEDSLLSHGYTIKARPEDVQTTPWSCVKRFLTSDGYIYLKQTPPGLSLEPAITQILYDQFHANVPCIIAADKILNCFLMKDAGNPLRDFLKGNFQPDLLCQAIKTYTAIQYAVTAKLTIFTELGVPDWRLKELPRLYSEFISQEALLKEDGLTQNELILLHKLSPQFSAMCEHLSRYKIPETLDHCDFHDNNILIEDGTYHMTIIDLGETVVTHPFFSLLTCIRNARFRYALKETDEIYLGLQDACLDGHLFELEQRNILLEAFSLAEKLWPIYASLGEYRLMMSSNPEKYQSLNRRGRLVMGFKEFIKTTTL